MHHGPGLQSGVTSTLGKRRCLFPGQSLSYLPRGSTRNASCPPRRLLRDDQQQSTGQSRAIHLAEYSEELSTSWSTLGLPLKTMQVLWLVEKDHRVSMDTRMDDARPLARRPDIIPTPLTVHPCLVANKPPVALRLKNLGGAHGGGAAKAGRKTASNTCQRSQY